MLVLLWAIRKATSYVLDHLQARVMSANENTRLRWAAHGWLLVKRIAQLLLLTLWVSVAYLWFTYVLANFPLDPAAGRALVEFPGRHARDISAKAWSLRFPGC